MSTPPDGFAHRRWGGGERAPEQPVVGQPRGVLLSSELQRGLWWVRRGPVLFGETLFSLLGQHHTHRSGAFFFFMVVLPPLVPLVQIRSPRELLGSHNCHFY